MENPEAKSKWDDLVRELAVEIPPEVQQREEAAAASKPQATAPPSRQREVPPAPLPRKSATNWNSLVTDLGLPPLEELEPVSAAPPTRPEVSKEVSQPEAPREREREPEQARGRRPNRQNREPGGGERPHRRGHREESGRHRERSQQVRDEPPSRRERLEQDRDQTDSRRDDEEQGREQSEPRREGRGRRGGRGRGRGRGRDRVDSRGERDEGDRNRGRVRSEEQDREHERERDRQQQPEGELMPAPELEEVAAELMPPSEPPQKPAAVSLWHKIFGSPAEQTAKVVDEPADEAGSAFDLRNEPRSAGSGFADAHPDDQMQTFGETDQESRSSDLENAGDEEGRSDRPRGRSRRRGRGRGRKPDERQPEGRAPRQRKDEPRVERSQPELEDEFSDEELMEDPDTDVLLEENGDDGGDSNGVMSESGISRSAALQRSIPSWDEAIGFIVDSNMQSRSQRRPPSRSGGGSRDNGSRGGRGRGRRKN